MVSMHPVSLNNLTCSKRRALEVLWTAGWLTALQKMLLPSCLRTMLFQTAAGPLHGSTQADSAMSVQSGSHSMHPKTRC